MLVLYQAHDIGRPSVFLLIGSFLGACMLFSTVSLLMLTGMCAAYAGWRILSERPWRALVPCAAAALAPMLAALLLSVSARIRRRRRTAADVRPQPEIHASHPVDHVLSFGPVSSARPSESCWRQRRTISIFTPLWFVLALCGVFFFLVDLPDSPNSIGWHAAKVGLLGLHRSSGSLFRRRGGAADGFRLRPFRLWRCSVSRRCRRGDRRRTTPGRVDRAEGPAFRWTVLLSPGELEVSSRSRTAPSRVRAARSNRWNAAAILGVIPAFAERRMATGLPLSMIPLAKYEKANAEIRGLFHVDERGRCVRRGDTPLHRLPRHRSARTEQVSALEALLDAHKSHFVPAFRNGTLTVYYVPRDRGQPGCR